MVYKEKQNNKYRGKIKKLNQSKSFNFLTKTTSKKFKTNKQTQASHRCAAQVVEEKNDKTRKNNFH